MRSRTTDQEIAAPTTGFKVRVMSVSSRRVALTDHPPARWRPGVSAASALTLSLCSTPACVRLWIRSPACHIRAGEAIALRTVLGYSTRTRQAAGAMITEELAMRVDRAAVGG